MKFRSLIRRYKTPSIPYYYFVGYQKKWDISKDIKNFSKIAKSCIDTKLTLLNYDRLYTIFQLIENTKEGDILIEVGAYKGGTSLFISKILGQNDYELYIIDTFDGHKDFNEVKDGNLHINNKLFVDTSFEAVSSLFNSNMKVKVFKKRIQDFDLELDLERISFIHLDTDLYEPTKFVLEKYALNMKIGGVILIDDYGKHTTLGIFSATQEFLNKNRSKFFFIHLITAQGILIRLQ